MVLHEQPLVSLCPCPSCLGQPHAPPLPVDVLVAQGEEIHWGKSGGRLLFIGGGDTGSDTHGASVSPTGHPAVPAAGQRGSLFASFSFAGNSRNSNEQTMER